MSPVLTDIGVCKQAEKVPQVEKAPETVREVLDRRIADHRKAVESLCIQKAKCETIGVLDHPMEFYQNLVWSN